MPKRKTSKKTNACEQDGCTGTIVPSLNPDAEVRIFVGELEYVGVDDRMCDTCKCLYGTYRLAKGGEDK